MVKVTINGEVYPFDTDHYPLSEAVELEEGLGMDFAVWQRKLTTGSAKAIAGYVWLVLKRNGQDVSLADVLSGKFAMNTDDLSIDSEEADPTSPGSPPDTGSGSESSPSSTTTPRRRSGHSASPSSTTSSGT